MKKESYFNNFFKIVWQDKIALFCCVILSVLCISLKLFFDDGPVVTLISNVSFGYIGGYAFYIPSVIIPKTRKYLDIKTTISNQSSKIVEYIWKIENMIYGKQDVSYDDWCRIMGNGLSNGPFERDLSKMNQPIAIRQDVLEEFAVLDMMMADLKNLLIDNPEKEILYKSIIRYTTMYNIYVKSGYTKEFMKLSSFGKSMFEVRELLKK